MHKARWKGVMAPQTTLRSGYNSAFLTATLSEQLSIRLRCRDTGKVHKPGASQMICAAYLSVPAFSCSFHQSNPVQLPTTAGDITRLLGQATMPSIPHLLCAIQHHAEMHTSSAQFSDTELHTSGTNGDGVQISARPCSVLCPAATASTIGNVLRLPASSSSSASC